MEIMLAIAVFGGAMLAMGVGVMVAGRRLRGSCGGVEVHGHDGDAISCGACPSAEAEVCPSDDPLIALSRIAHPDPAKHH